MRTEDGTYETTFYDAPVNYRDASGRLVPIDTTLVPAGRAGAALRNAAGEVQVSLPSVLGANPVRVSRGDVSVAFTLSGAKATPGLGLPAGSPVPASDEARRATATYADAMPGVDVSYTATARGVKEDLVLAGPDSPTSFDFEVLASPGLAPVETPAGGISFVDAEGVEQAAFAPTLRL